MKAVLRLAAIIVVAATTAACSKPTEAELQDAFAKQHQSELRDSFAQQVGANKFIKDFQQNGEELTFTGPGAEGGEAKWRVHIDSATIEPNDDPAQPYKGTVKSSWYSNGKLVQPRGRDSNLPLELTDNGIAQDCWALWDKAAKKWGWE